MTAMVETGGLCRRFGARRVVEDVTITVPAGAVYGFVGANGSGKTTTLRMLLGLLAPDAGRIAIAGLDIARNRIAVAAMVGALLEAQGFYPNLTGRQNLDLARRLRGLPATEIGRVLALVDLSHAGTERVSGYSLGMRQRLGLARALLGSPRLLILDEPTNGLDPDGIAMMRGFLRALPERTGASVLVSSHLLSEVEQAATHVGMLRHGRLVCEGSLTDLRAAATPVVSIESTAAAAVTARLVAAGFAASVSDAGARVGLGRGDDAAAAVAAICRALIGEALPFTAVATRRAALEDLYRDLADADLREAV